MKLNVLLVDAAMAGNEAAVALVLRLLADVKINELTMADCVLLADLDDQSGCAGWVKGPSDGGPGGSRFRGVLIMLITAKHPVRAAVCSLATYHENKGCMMDAVCACLDDHNIRAESAIISGPNGFATLKLYPVSPHHIVCESCGKVADEAEYANSLVLSWYTMDSGRVELTVYVSQSDYLGGNDQLPPPTRKSDYVDFDDGAG